MSAGYPSQKLTLWADVSFLNHWEDAFETMKLCNVIIIMLVPTVITYHRCFWVLSCLPLELVCLEFELFGYNGKVRLISTSKDHAKNKAFRCRKNTLYPFHGQNQNHGFSSWFQFPFFCQFPRKKTVSISAKRGFSFRFQFWSRRRGWAMFQLPLLKLNCRQKHSNCK